MPGFAEYPSLSQLVCSVEEEVRTAELLAQPDVLAADAGALLQLVRCLRDVDYTGHDSLHYLTRHFVLARLMLQPIWHRGRRAGVSDVGTAVAPGGA